MDLEIRPIVPDEFAAFFQTNATAFGWKPQPGDVELMRSVFEFDRSLAAFTEGKLVATAGALSFTMTLPGLTQLPVAGVSWVGVLPTYHRRGILRAIMQRQLGDVRERGESMAILVASESIIYGRFGYGLAASSLNLEIDCRDGAFARPLELAGRYAIIDAEAAHTLFPAVYERVRAQRPGALSRSAAWWGNFFHRLEASTSSEPTYYVSYESQPGQVDGIVAYWINRQWNEGIAASALSLHELVATTPEAEAALWRYCLDMDLVQTVRARRRPVDGPLRWLLADPRRLRTTALVDDIWVRLIDIPAALTARRYNAVGRIVLEVADPFLTENMGRYALEGGPDGAECRRTEAEPDLALTIADLGAVYLGGVSFATLARAGRVIERAHGALRRADTLFASAPAPWTATDF